MSNIDDSIYDVWISSLVCIHYFSHKEQRVTVHDLYSDHWISMSPETFYQHYDLDYNGFYKLFFDL